MKTYCVKCRKNIENIDPKMVRTKNNRLIMQSKCFVCGIKKSRSVKEQEAKGLLSNLGIKTPSSKVPLLIFCFERNSIECVSKATSCKQPIKINEIVNKFLLVGDKFKPEMHLKQPGNTYSARGPFTKNQRKN